ncbi:MAG: molybdopterin-dependent oxidoreductase [Pseudomonadota bacterium]
MSRTKNTTCPYCGVGCGITATIESGQLIAVSGDHHHPANRGRLCVKGSNLHVTPIDANRLNTPIINRETATWPEAISTIANRLTRVIAEHGPEAVAFYLSGQLLTEDYYVANKLMKGFIGSSNVDTNSRLCMASAVAGHKRAFGEDVVPCDYDDLEQCDLLTLVGSNAAWAHPVLYQRVAAAKASTDCYVVVVDPRRTATCDIADEHLAIQPGSDSALFNGLLTWLVDHNALNQDYIEAHTNGFANTIEISSLSLNDASRITGIDAPTLAKFYARFAETERSVTMFSQGVNQSTSGTDKANAIINCHLATGKIGMPGCGPFSITGQPNAMGGREVGGMANQLASHMDFNEDSIAAVGEFWDAPAMATSPGTKAVDMFDGIRAGDIKAVWIMGTNPAVSLPDSGTVRKALAQCPLVIVSDCSAANDTLAYADIALPAQPWGEKDGTVTDSERVISRQRQLVEPATSAKPDWQIVSEVAVAMGFREAFGYTHPQEIFLEHAALSGVHAKNRLFDISHLAHLSREQYDELLPQQWPLSRPFSDNRFSTPDGRANFVPVAWQAPTQQVAPNSDVNLILNSGRLRDQWHTMARTGHAAKLFQHRWQPSVQIHPSDAKVRAIRDGDLVQMNNALGEARLIASVTTDVAAGSLFAPIHWSDQFTTSGCINHLVQPVTDPHSGQPESKHAVVSLKRVEAQNWLRLVIEQPIPTQTIPNETVDFWCCARGPSGWQYDIALSDDSLTTLIERLSLHISAELRGPEQNTLYGTHPDWGQWLLSARPMPADLPDLALLHTRLATSRSWQTLCLLPDDINKTNSPMICTCFEVRRSEIDKAIKQGANTVTQLGHKLRCGTNCGSCVPELNQRIEAVSDELTDSEDPIRHPKDQTHVTLSELA